MVKHGANLAEILLLDWGRDMQELSQCIDAPDVGRVQLLMPGVLRQVGDKCSSIEGEGGCDVGSNCQVQKCTKPGGYFELRHPEIGETPLSPDEIGHARRIGVIE